MKVLIVQPKHRSYVKLYGKAYMSQLTLPVLASQVPSGNDVQILDENVEEINFSDKPDIVYITTMTPAATRAYEIADEYRKRGVKVLMGGVHVSSLPEEAAKHADSVVIGESEGLFPLIFEDLKNGGLKPTYRLTEKPDLKDFPFPRHELMNGKMYVNIPKVETSRGCPFTCEFCSTTEFFGNKMRYRPVKDVIQEVKELDEDFVFFTDNNIIGRPKYAKELFKELAPLGIRWISQCSINLANDDELLRLAAQSGCGGMLIGFESISEDSIAAIGKSVNKVEEYKKSIKKIHKAGIGIIGCFVLGFDDDDHEVFRKTLKFIKRTNIEMPQLTVLTPFPGTVLRRKMEDDNRILTNDWRLYDGTSVLFKPKWMTVKELGERYNWLSRKLYNYPSILYRVFKSLLRYRSITKSTVFWQVNVVYRRLWMVGMEPNN